MTAFLHAIFWLCLFSGCIRLLILGAREYPATVQVTQGEDLAKLIEYIIWTVWSGVLLWGCL